MRPDQPAVPPNQVPAFNQPPTMPGRGQGPSPPGYPAYTGSAPAQFGPAGQPGMRVAAAPAPSLGCLTGFLAEISGITFLLQLKRRLGTTIFSAALGIVLLFMFICGASIVRYAHLGEHSYIMQILPMASVFSPLLALLMCLAFGLGDVITNATYWLFPNNRVLNLYTLFDAAHPLLTWGAYLRMDFLSLPFYAVLPGLGARLLYGIASRSFQAGRAKIIKDGGAPPSGRQQALAQAQSQRDALAQQAEAAATDLGRVESDLNLKAEQIRAAEGAQSEAADGLQRANADTSRLNQEVKNARADVESARQQAQQADFIANENIRARESWEQEAVQADGDLRASSTRSEELRERISGLKDEQQQNSAAIREGQNRVKDLTQARDEVKTAVETGHAPDGRPLSPDEMRRAQESLVDTQNALAAEQEKLAGIAASQHGLFKKLQASNQELKTQEAHNQELLNQYRESQLKAEQARAEEAAQRRRQQEMDAEAARREEAMKAAQERAAASQRQAEDAQKRLQAAQQQKQAVLQDYNQALQQRNQIAQQAQQLTQQQAQAEEQLADLQRTAGMTPPAAAARRTGRRPSRRPGSTDQTTDQGGRGLYAGQEEQRRSREELIRRLQDQYQGSLPSGVGSRDVAGVGSMASQGLVSLGAAALGAMVGTIVGGALLHGHMWAEYFPIRVITHPDGVADPSCYKMDSGYLDGNILSGAASAAGTGPAVSVLGADTGGIGPAGATQPVPGASAPADAPGSWKDGGAPAGEEPLPDDAKKAYDDARKYKDEADRMRKQFEDFDRTADKTDPNYEKNKKQYDDYIKWNDNAATDADQRGRDAVNKAAEDKANRDLADANRKQWLKDRQDDIRSLAEEKAHTEAVAAGAAAAGLNTDEHRKRLDQIDQRLKGLHDQLQKEGEDIDYTARDRGVISPSKDLLDAAERSRKRKEESDLIDKLGKWQKTADKAGMTDRTGADGDDMFDRIQKIKDRINAGEKVDESDIDRVRRVIGDRITGTSASSDDLPKKEKLGGWFDKDLWGDAATETGRNLGQLQNADGTMSWSGLGGRIAIGILTGGASEWVFTPAGAIYTIKDGVDKGLSNKQALGNALVDVLIQHGMGKAIEGGVGILGGGLRGGLAGGLPGAWSGGTKAGGEFVKGLGKEFTLPGMGDSLTKIPGQFSTKTWANNLTNWAGGAAGGAADDAVPGASRPPLTDGQKAVKNRVDSLVDSLDNVPKDDLIAKARAKQEIVDLYRNGGMKKLADAQKAGAIDADTARKVNAVIRDEINGAVKDGTKKSVQDFWDKKKVGLDEILVGDSGSTAKGPTSRLKTDADRTLVPKFNDKDLSDYAKMRGISKGDAYDELAKDFKKVHDSNVDDFLQDRGLTKDDIGYSSYDRIGGKSGNADSYPQDYTNARTSVQGEADVYKVSRDNSVRDPYRTSGQTMVDQNNLNKYNASGKSAADFDDFARDPTYIRKSEVPDLVNQQAQAVEGKTDPDKVAKALSRTAKAAAINGDSLPNSKAVGMAEYIRNNPGASAAQVEDKFGMSMNDFVEQGKQQIFNYDLAVH